MSKTVNIGGDRLGSGNRMETTMHGFSRSTHDLSYLWKSTMSPGTLVPFMSIPALPGDTFDIDLDAAVRTVPTIGPLFGSFKLQLDVFSIPIRLYNKVLHNNALGVGMKMNEVYFPLLQVKGLNIDVDELLGEPVEFQQINQSSLLAYLGLRGVGGYEHTALGITRTINAIPYLSFWDIFKNYYANKQEDIAYYIVPEKILYSSATVNGANVPQEISLHSDIIRIIGQNITKDNVQVLMDAVYVDLKWVFETVTQIDANTLECTNVFALYIGATLNGGRINPKFSGWQGYPTLRGFELTNIDEMREAILSAPKNTPYVIDENAADPYVGAIELIAGTTFLMKSKLPQCGLPVKTYQSDIFNNWIKSDYIEGPNSIAELSRVSTVGDSFTIDTLNLSKKVYDMFNRIAVSGASYQDYIEAVYDHNSKWRAEAPIYQGGLSKEIVFQEVVSTAVSGDEPLGSLAGKGTVSSKHKGGKVIINIDEPSYIMGIVSITPRIDYSQGNSWDIESLKTIDDLHKPSLDGIGYQDLLANTMHFAVSDFTGGVQTVQAVGKQPAWINYMTNFNKSFGNFADPRAMQFMTLNRKYRIAENGEHVISLEDATSYIDPSKFNYAFAQTDLTAMNFMIQIAINNTARRKMSAKIIPNL